MGKLIADNKKNIINNNIQDYLKQSTDIYSKWLEGTPTFVTYYNKHQLASTADVGLENVIEVVGVESPIQYSKIKDFPIYGLENIDITSENDEYYGMMSSADSTGIIIPNTIVPYTDDFFSISYVKDSQTGTPKLFKIIEVQVDKLQSGQQFYRIQFDLARDPLELIEEQIEENYETLYDHIGTDEKVVVKSSDYRILQFIEEIKDSLITFYERNYLHKTFNIFFYRYNNYNLYNEYIVKFIKENSLLTRKNTYLKAIYVHDIFGDDGTFDEFYENSLYYALQYGIKDKDYLSNLKENFSPVTIHNNSMPFFNHYEKFYKCDYVFTNDFIISPFNNELIVKILDGTNYLNTLNEIDDKEHLIENIIIDHMNDRLTLNEDLLKKIDRHSYYPNLKDFLLIPCLLFILNSYENRLIR